MDPRETKSTLTYENVLLASSFIALNVALSYCLELGIGFALSTAALRCVLQLAFVAQILKNVFDTDDPWVVALIVVVLNFLGAFEAVVNKSKRRFQYMFRVVLLSMLASTIPISIMGAKWAMSITPVWTPSEYIPIVGMLCGSTVSGIVVVVSHLMKELQDNRDRVEIYLAFGASRSEACRPIAVDALRLALTPNINQMSVVGIIAIPGMMTGALLGGSSVQQAAKLQMIIMFMISASTALASIFVTIACIVIVVDGDDRIRSERIQAGPHPFWKRPTIFAHSAISQIKETLRLVRHLGRSRRAGYLGHP